jgi:hypothetical protein
MSFDLDSYALCQIFIGIIIFLVLFSLLSSKNFRNECISVGILGTFVGISLSLFEFDSNKVSDSIPAFINGLKFAFITSGSGVIASIILSLSKPDSEASDLRELVRLQNKQVQVLETSLSNLAANSTTEITKALQEVVTDFNNNLTEQFGDNFKALNEAVSSLVVWQEQYRAFIEAHHSQTAKQHELTMQRLNEFEQLDNRRTEQLHRQGDGFIQLLKQHANSLKDQASGIATATERFSKTTENVSDSLDASFQKLNRRIDQSVTLAEDNISTLIGIANGTLR